MLTTVAEDGGPCEVQMPGAKDDVGLVIRAAQFAAHKHKDQRRKDVKATPYINQPINLQASTSVSELPFRRQHGDT